MKQYSKWIVGLLIGLASLAFIAAVFVAGSNSDSNLFSQMVGQITGKKQEEKKDQEPEEEKVVPTNKSKAAKQKAMAEDEDTMNSYGLYYDYANLSLEDTVKAYMDEYGIDHSQVAFSYKNTKSNERFSFNDTQPMTAGSTYKLPLNMLVMDEVAKGKLSLEDEFDITNTQYEYQGEHDNYVAAFGGMMTIPDMQVYSLVYSENTPAYALAERLGGMDKVYTMYDRYGTSKSAEIKTISLQNKTTTDYFIQVLEHLWKDQKKYSEILRLTGESFPGEYYKSLLPGLKIDQKPGYVNEALNVNAVVYEETPYLVALYTAGLGGTTTASTEISGVGLYQVGQLAYVINEWHRVNMNP